MKATKKRIFAALLAGLLLFPVLGATAVSAASAQESFQIEVNMNIPDSDQVYDARMYLYKAASAQVDSTGNLHMEPTALYQDIVFDGLTQEQIPSLLDELCGRLEYPGSVPDTALGLAPLAIQNPGSDGIIHFDQLEAGVYLLVKWNQEGPNTLEVSPALVYLPRYNQERDIWEHTAIVNPKFSQIPTPTEPSAPDPQLPQTGMLQWPIPLLVLSGLFLLIIGCGIVRGGKQE